MTKKVNPRGKEELKLNAFQRNFGGTDNPQDMAFMQGAIQDVSVNGESSKYGGFKNGKVPFSMEGKQKHTNVNKLGAQTKGVPRNGRVLG